MRILGIDPSYKRTGVAIIEDKELVGYTSTVFGKIKTKKDKRKIIRNFIKHIEAKYLPDKITIERTRLYSHGFISVKTIIALGSLISTVIDATNLDVYSVDSRAFKSKIIGSAKCSKKDVINWVEREFSAHANEDEADAIAIASYPFIDKPLLRKENN